MLYFFTLLFILSGCTPKPEGDSKRKVSIEFQNNK